MLRSLSFFLALSALLACNHQLVAERATSDFNGCSDVAVSAQSGDRYRASGCGSEATYVCVDACKGLDCNQFNLTKTTCIREDEVAQPSSRVNDGRFYMPAAVASLATVAQFAGDCRTAGDARGDGEVVLVFGFDGSVEKVDVVGEAFQGNAVGTCVGEKFSRVKVPAYRQEKLQAVKKRFSVQ
jgi:hypothetical protein